MRKNHFIDKALHYKDGKKSLNEVDRYAYSIMGNLSEAQKDIDSLHGMIQDLKIQWKQVGLQWGIKEEE